VPTGLDGWYVIVGKINAAFTPTTSTYMQVYIQLNGGNAIAAQMAYRSSGGSTVNANAVAVRYLTAGDYVECYANHASASAITLYGGSEKTTFSMVRISPKM